MNSNNVNKMVKAAVLSALSVIFMMLIRFPIIPSAPFLEFEPGDVPALIGAFMYGPGYGFIITAVVSLIQAMTVSAGSGWIGAAMHLLATGAMVITAGAIYKKNRTFKGAIIALIVGSISMTLVMIPLNLYITPKFLGVPFNAVVKMLPVIIAFNLIKSGINSVITIILYKSVGRVLNLERTPQPKRAE